MRTCVSKRTELNKQVVDIDFILVTKNVPFICNGIT